MKTVCTLVRIGVPLHQGGSGGCLKDAVEGIIALAEQRPAMAMRVWAQKVCIGCLQLSANVGLRERYLPPLLDGLVAGAAAIWMQMLLPERHGSVGISAQDRGCGWRLSGRLPPTPNLSPCGYVAALPFSFDERVPYAVLLVAGERDGITRVDCEDPSASSSLTATLELRQLTFPSDDLITMDGPTLVEQLRPFALALRCGVLVGQLRAQRTAMPELAELSAELMNGLRHPRFNEGQAELLLLHGKIAGLLEAGRRSESVSRGIFPGATTS